MANNKDSANLKEMIRSGVNNIYNHYPQIDKLNVFPIPDGDTGTNMNLTCSCGFLEIEKLDTAKTCFAEIMAKFSRGLIMSARGNSGVIFSQIIKGFSKAFDQSESLDVQTWNKGFISAKEVAYKAVMKPVEGTILTVIRETSEWMDEFLKQHPNIELKEYFSEVVVQSNKSLKNTPNLLEVLKKIGVVDSGGFGLVKFLEGINNYIQEGRVIERVEKLEENDGQNIEMELEEEFGYCTEAIVLLNQDAMRNINIEEIRNVFESFGNTSIVVVRDDNILKIHTHALLPGNILNELQKYGDFQTIKVENMTLQSDQHVKGGNKAAKNGLSQKTMTIIDDSTEKPRKLLNRNAVIAVVPSKKIQNHFKNELGMDFIINGGPKMNPSTQHFLKAIAEVDAKDVYILPNDSNIIMAANQAKQLEKKSKVHILPTKSVMAGMVAYLSIDLDETPKRNIDAAKKALKDLTSIAISIATKRVKLDGVSISEGDWICLVNEKMFIASKDIQEIFKKVFTKYITLKTEIITIFAGVEASHVDIAFLRKYLDENFDVEYEIIQGGQEIYPYLISIE